MTKAEAVLQGFAVWRSVTVSRSSRARRATAFGRFARGETGFIPNSLPLSIGMAYFVRSFRGESAWYDSVELELVID